MSRVKAEDEYYVLKHKGEHIEWNFLMILQDLGIINKGQFTELFFGIKEIGANE